MRYVTLIPLMLLSVAGIACHCSLFHDLGKTDIDQSDYIALVRVKEILPVKIDSLKYLRDYFFKIRVEEISHFKGSHLEEIIVDGGHPKFNTWTSCDFDIDENEEWMIFGKADRGHIIMYPCWWNVKYKQANGFRNWQYQTGIQELKFVENYFNKPPAVSRNRNSQENYFYPNGQIERIETYKSGKLNGPIVYYYPDGSLYGKGTYKNGLLQNDLIWYSPDGFLSNKSHYNKGIQVDTTVYYANYGGTSQITNMHIYDNKGRVLCSREYSGGGNRRFLRTEHLWFWPSGKEKIIYFHDSGTVRSIQNKTNSLGEGDYAEYDVNGNITKQWKYDSLGRTVK